MIVRRSSRTACGRLVTSTATRTSTVPLVNALREVLGQRPYPGRGCVAVRLADGNLWLAYFLTGRSSSSRSRRLEPLDEGDLRVSDTSGGAPDALRHYIAAAQRWHWTVIGNGDQVEPIASALAAGTAATEVWARHTYEPDPPIHTPRIWIAVDHEREALLVGCARRSRRQQGDADRVLWMPESLDLGSGVLITTYAGTTTDVVTSAQACDVTTDATDATSLLDEIWEALAPDLAVAACVIRPGQLASTLAMHNSVP